MEKDKHTILLISNDNSKVKSFTIDSKYILNYRTYLKRGALILTVIALVLFLIFYYSVKLKFDNGALQSQVMEFNRKSEYLDSIKLIEKLEKIDNNLAEIDGYLKSRGILKQQNIGGEVTAKQPSYNDMLNSLGEQSVVFSNLLRNIPIGFPFYGELSSNYGYRRNPFGGYSGEFHSGIDIKGDYGDPIFATADGIVNRCDWYGGYGNAVVLNHENGYQTIYGHMQSVKVEHGQEVKAGEIIGYIGSTGRSTGPHVHYEIRKDGIDIDPMPYLKIN